MHSRAVLLLPLKGMERGFLMVQRPYEGSGLLAGLGELPGGCAEVQCAGAQSRAHTLPSP